MSEKYPLIRVPTRPARMRSVDLIVFLGFFAGLCFGLKFGAHHFGVVGAIVGAIAGGVLGIVIGTLPSYVLQEQMFRKMQKSSNDELRAMLEHKLWSFYQTLALLNLQLRGEDVQSYRPRILALLESSDEFERLFGRDALALVFTPLAKRLHDYGYDPKASVQDCQSKVARLRENLS